MQRMINVPTCASIQACPRKSEYNQEEKTYKNDALTKLAFSYVGKR